MKKQIILGSAFLLFFVAVGMVQMPSYGIAGELPSGMEIMEKQKKLQGSSDEKELISMVLTDKRGKEKKRRLVRYAIKLETGLNKLMIKFLKPNDIKGTGLLTWEQKDRDDDQWLYLPALKKEKRIASSGKKNKFMGTDFTFEDLRPENLDVHNYQTIGSETLDGNDCFVVEATPSTVKEKKESGYGKRKLWIRKDIYFTIKAEFYNKKNQLIKVQHGTNLKNISGSVWRSNNVTMENLRSKHKTAMITRKRALNSGIKELFFSVSTLKRR